MNSRRSLLDTVNDGRQRRPLTALEQLNRSLQELEEWIDRRRADMAPRSEPTPPRQGTFRSDAGGNRDRYAAPSRHREHEPRSAWEQSHRTGAQGMDQLREGHQTIRDSEVARELASLRKELRHQMTAGLRSQFEALRRDIGRSDAAHSERTADQFVEAFARISSAIKSLGERNGDEKLGLLREELEEVKAALKTLAREETLLSVDRRWKEFDRRLGAFEHRLTADVGQRGGDPGLSDLADRLEQISEAVASLPESLSLASLEDKVRMLASALEHFVGNPPPKSSAAFAQLEERLDEISRAIVASSVAAQSQQFDPSPIERIEARIASLARQVEEVAADRAASEVAERLDSLSRRVEELAARTEMPAASLDRLASQIALIADRIESAPALLDADAILAGVEQRFDMLSALIERREGDAVELSDLLLREIERRLGEVADRLDQRHADAALDGKAMIDAMDSRLAALAERLQEGVRTTTVDALRGIDDRLDDMSGRLDVSAAKFEGIDPDLIRSLEAQLAGLAAQLARPALSFPELDDLGPRLDEIERRIADGRQAVLEAARQAAENAARSMAGRRAESEAIAALAEDLKALEMLARRSDERNSRTFETIQDTLLKIVDRLSAIEVEREMEASRSSLAPDETPSIDPGQGMPRASARQAAQPAGAAAEPNAEGSHGAASFGSGSLLGSEPGRGLRSMLGGLFGGVRQSGPPGQVEPPISAGPGEQSYADAFPEPHLDPKAANRPLEPGSGAPDLKAMMRRVREERGEGAAAAANMEKADFIAAARRAAQAAAADATEPERQLEPARPEKALRLADLLKNRRTAIAVAAAGLATALAGLQLGRSFMPGDMEGAGIDALSAGMPGADTASQPARRAAAILADLASRQQPGSAQPKSATAGADSAIATSSTNPGNVSAKVPLFDIPVDAGPPALRYAASSGDPRALLELAARYAEGRGTRQNSAQAARWYETAAELGFAPAQLQAGIAYERGVGLPRDIARSKSWYRRAAEQGNVRAMHNLAELLGGETPADHESAALWFRKAAELGLRDSQFSLGALAAEGLGTPRNLEESYKWFALAARTGDRAAAARRDEIAAALAPEELDRALATVRSWKPKPLDPQANSAELDPETGVHRPP